MMTTQQIQEQLYFFKNAIADIANNVDINIDVRIEALQECGETAPDLYTGTEVIDCLIINQFDTGSYENLRFKVIDLIDLVQSYFSVLYEYRHKMIDLTPEVNSKFNSIDWGNLMCEYDTEEFGTYYQYVVACNKFALTQLLLSGYNAFTVEW